MRILLITSDLPQPSSMPGSPRVFSLFQHIAQYHEIHLGTFTSSLWSNPTHKRSNDRFEAVLAHVEASQVFQTVNILPYPEKASFWGKPRHHLARVPFFITRYRFPDESRLIRRRIGELIRSKNPDLLYVDRLPGAQYVLDFNMLPRVVDAHDAHSQNFRERAVHAASPVEKLRLWLESRNVRRFEVATARAVDAYLVNSPVDREILQAYHPDMHVCCIPNGVDTIYFAPSRDVENERTLVFTGVMGYAPNRDAVSFFCSRILPRIREVLPEVEVQLVGSNPPAEVRALSGNGVTVTGTVSDVRPFVHRATVYVSPLRFGTGIKNKILAALAMGKAVVATSASCAGLDVTPEEHLLIGDTPEDFAAQIVKLLTDPNRRRSLGIAGRNLVVQRYRWEVMGGQVQSLCESLVRSRNLPYVRRNVRA
jgi:sugar transferase (PEP-CTERM/EpsH1 system associated)